jgi:membrane protease YdiL (CAAX protease family)
MRNHWLRAVVGFVWGLLLFLGIAWSLKIVLDRVVGRLVCRDARAVDAVATRRQKGGLAIVLSTLGVGWACAVLRARSKSLLPAIACHVIGNVAGVPGGIIGVIIYRLVYGRIPVPFTVLGPTRLPWPDL